MLIYNLGPKVGGVSRQRNVSKGVGAEKGRRIEAPTSE